MAAEQASDRMMEWDKMMDWNSYYQRCCMSAEQAVAPIRSGQRVFLGSNAAEPQKLVQALTGRADQLADTELIHILTLGLAPASAAQFQNQFRHNAFFIGQNTRDAVNACRADYTPLFLSEIPALFRCGQVPLDYTIVQVSPPDAHGYCSLGISVDVVKAAVETASFVIAEVNPQMPRTLGDSFLHVTQIQAFVPCDYPLLELTPPPQTEATQRIGGFIADLIEDGATLQMGIGAIPDAVLAHLHQKRDLGIHTEMFSDGVIGLFEAGAITNRRKTLHRGKIITSFCMGTRALYDFVHDNPAVEFHPTEYVNDPFIIAQNDQMVSINAAIEVDLTGQVCADSIGERFYSGIGGQVDFIRGAARSRGGKPIIALPSTAALPNGQRISRIVSDLKPGAGVVTSRGDVHYVVTEWGIAYLHGKSIRQRAMELVRIAHPDFREDLLAAAKGRCLIMPDIDIRAFSPRYPEELELVTLLDDGTELRIRPIRSTDEDLLRDFYYRLSDQTVSQYLHFHPNALPHTERLKLVTIDYRQHMALIVTHDQDGREEMLGEARYIINQATRRAEVTCLVRDDWQGRGIGTLLMNKLLETGNAQQVTGFDASVQASNEPMKDLLLRLGFVVLPGDDPTVCRMRLSLLSSGKPIACTPMTTHRIAISTSSTPPSMA
jgi:acyl-CoA hydrolase/GNAT superfamily N-acetyltransferase